MIILLVFASCGNNLETKYQSVEDAKSLTVHLVNGNSRMEWSFALEDGDEDFDKDGKRDFDGSVMMTLKEPNSTNKNIVDITDTILTAIIEKKTVSTSKFDVFGLKKKNEIKVRYFLVTRKRHEYFESEELTQKEALKKTKEESEDLKLFNVEEIDKDKYNEMIHDAQEYLKNIKKINKELNFSTKTYNYDKVYKKYYNNDYEVYDHKKGFSFVDKKEDEAIVYFILNINNTKLLVPDFAKIVDNK